MARMVLTLAFLIFLKSQWLFLNCSSLTYVILSFLLILQNYSVCESVIYSLKHQKVKKQQQNR